MGHTEASGSAATPLALLMRTARFPEYDDDFEH
jgi:hypothetical protein